MILDDHLVIAKINEGARGQEGFVLLVEGRINQSEDRAKVMLFESLDGLAAIMTEIHGLVDRAGVSREFVELCNERWAKMPQGPGA